MTHCDKKPRGKVGGSAISVYQALLHLPIESLGTKLNKRGASFVHCNLCACGNDFPVASGAWCTGNEAACGN